MIPNCRSTLPISQPISSATDDAANGLGDSATCGSCAPECGAPDCARQNPVCGPSSRHALSRVQQLRSEFATPSLMIARKISKPTVPHKISASVPPRMLACGTCPRNLSNRLPRTQRDRQDVRRPESRCTPDAQTRGIVYPGVVAPRLTARPPPRADECSMRKTPFP